MKGLLFVASLKLGGMLLAHGSWLWEVPEGFYRDIDFIWAEAHDVARRIRALDADPSSDPLVLVVGSSFVIYDIDDHLLRTHLADDHAQAPAEVVTLAVGGAPATDVERMVRAIPGGRTGVLVYLTAARDYPNKKDFDAKTTPLATVLQPHDAWLPQWQGDLSTYVDDLLSMYLELYRYRAFVRQRLQWELRQAVRRLGGARGGGRQRPLPPADAENVVAFDAFRGERAATLDLYIEWLGTVKEDPSRYLGSQQGIRIATYDPNANEQVAALHRLLNGGVQKGLTPVLVYPPVNPFVRGGSTPFFDRSLAEVYRDIFREAATAAGGTAVDYRDFGDLDEFADFNHLNARGRTKFSQWLARLLGVQVRAFGLGAQANQLRPRETSER